MAVHLPNLDPIDPSRVDVVHRTETQCELLTSPIHRYLETAPEPDDTVKIRQASLFKWLRHCYALPRSDIAFGLGPTLRGPGIINFAPFLKLSREIPWLPLM